MVLPQERDISELHDLEVFAKELSNYFSPGDVVVLEGNLGSGKTTLIKNICSEFEINDVNSPSFAIVNEYHGKINIYHFDFYRIKKIEELYDIGFEDYLLDNNSIIFIEWGNLFPEILPQKYFRLFLKLNENNNRKVTITKKN